MAFRYRENALHLTPCMAAEIKTGRQQHVPLILFRILAAEMILVIRHRASDHLMCFQAAIDMGDFADALLVGQMLIGQKVMFQPVDVGFRAIGNIASLPVKLVAFHDRDDLVIGFTTVQQTESADRDGLQQNVAVGNASLAQHAYIQRVAVAFANDFP